ncbi:hypothetical protein D3C85_1167900 [compost metagenome]
MFHTGSVKHTLLVGVDGDRYVNLTNTFNLSTTAVYDKINTLDPNKFVPRTDMPDTQILSSSKTPTDRIGFYFQDLIALSEKIKVLAGLRYSYQAVGVPKIHTVARNGKINNGTCQIRTGFLAQSRSRLSTFKNYFCFCQLFQ